MFRIVKVCLLVVSCFLVITSWSQSDFKSFTNLGNKAVEAEDYEKGLVYFEKALLIGTTDSSEVAWIAGMAAVCAQQLNNADKMLSFQQIAIQHNSADQYLYDAQVKLATQLKNNEALEEAYLKGRDNVEGYYSKYTFKLIYFYFNIGKYEQSVKSANDYLELKPGSSKAIYMKSTAHSALGNFSEAIPGFLGILSVKPDDYNANLQLGLVYYKQGSKIYDDAKNWYNEKTDATRMDYTEYRKKMLKSYEPYKQAIPYLQKAYGLKPDDASKKPLYNIYSRMDKPEEAAK